LAKRKVSTLKKVDFRKLMVCMKAEGLSDSTIQKEIALLKHLFNVAVDEWDWKDLPNPCVGLRLAGSKTRFVVVTSEQQHALRAALAECDNPYFWPMVEIVVETTLRKGSLLEMSRDNVDLENRVAHLWGKGRMVHIPLSLKTVEILKGLPEHPSRKYFPMTPNAVDMAWSGVRDKIGMPQLQFRDLRHVGATAYARHGMNSHQLQVQLGHSSTRMAEVYCNLVGQDSLDALDRIAKTQTVFEMPPPSNAPGDKIMGRNKAQRLANAFLAKVKEANATNAPTTAATTVASGSPGAAMPESMPRAPMDATEQFLASVAADTPDAAQLEPPTHAPQQEVHKQTAIERPQEMPLLDNEPRGTAPHHCPVQSGPLSEEYPQHQATGTYEGTAAPRGTSSGIEGALASNVIKVNFGRK
jgi:integrase